MQTDDETTSGLLRLYLYAIWQIRELSNYAYKPEQSTDSAATNQYAPI